MGINPHYAVVNADTIIIRDGESMLTNLPVPYNIVGAFSGIVKTLAMVRLQL